MATDHTVQQGEHVSSVAKKYGFTNYRVIWNHPNNAELKKKRQNPNVLFPGDRLFLPDRELRDESCSTDRRHRFKMRGPILKLQLILEDLLEKPIGNARCLLVLENEFRRVTTAADGRIEQVIPSDSHDAVLIIQDTQTPFNYTNIPIKIGNLDPVEEISGQQARLGNLGYFPGDGGGKDDQTFRSAVEEFQCDHSLRVDGICGPKTQVKLKQVHGC
jgi:hypothetical protein